MKKNVSSLQEGEEDVDALLKLALFIILLNIHFVVLRIKSVY